MCGIVGYIGSRGATELIMHGLEKLEYRGYDSAGIALICEGSVEVIREKGKLKNLSRQLEELSFNAKEARIGIGHTRWATHGAPSQKNAHPHRAGRVCIIHNGIIENYRELRDEIEREGGKLSSDTDSEVVAHILSDLLESGLDPMEALNRCCDKLVGSYSIVAFDSKRPEILMVGKSATPIIIGVGEKESFVASDIPAVLDSTRDIIVLEDGDRAIVSADNIEILNNRKAVTREIKTITWDPITAQKGGYRHFMLKEINEQPDVILETLRSRIKLQDSTYQSSLDLGDLDLTRVKRIVFVACGTAWHAALVAQRWIENICRVHCEVHLASEFRYRDPIIDDSVLAIAVSQSGETADTLQALELAKDRQAQSLAICNVIDSSITRAAQATIYTYAGPRDKCCQHQGPNYTISCTILIYYSASARTQCHQRTGD